MTISCFPDSWSEADLDDLPDDGHRYEIVDGCLLVTPLPTEVHQTIGGNLLFVLHPARPSGWRVLHGLGVRVPGGNFIPDLVVLKPGAATGVVWREAGDVAVVVEIASSSTRVTDRTLKAAKYAEAEIPSYWRIDADGAITVQTRPVDGAYERSEVFAAGVTVRIEEPFPVVIETADLIQ